MNKEISNSFKRLQAYCEKEKYMGYDPFDGLSSNLFQSASWLSSNRLVRLAWIQAFKRSPVNLRPLFRVKKDYNPKALGLFLSGFCNLYRQNPGQEYLDKMNFFVNKIGELTNKGWSGACWGYNFDWQARAFFQPKHTPTVVVSSFIANALLDTYEITGDPGLLTTARSTCDFILKDLSRTYDDKGNFSFSYSPLDKSVVFNASLLGARLLARVFNFTKEEILREEAGKSVAYCSDFQRKDGSWAYGLLPFHQWIDSFHTGYNLECISDYMEFSGDYQYKEPLAKGFNYYVSTFFTAEGIPKYYHNSIYPIDIHAPSQLAIIIIKLNKREAYGNLLDKVLNWTIQNMQSDKGYFYYQINKYFTSKIPYMRWSQAWMFYAFSIYFSKNRTGLTHSQTN